MPSFISDPELSSFVETINSLVVDVFNKNASPQLVTYSQLMLFRAIWPTLEFEENQTIRKRRVISNFINSLEDNFPEFIDVKSITALREELSIREREQPCPIFP